MAVLPDLSKSTAAGSSRRRRRRDQVLATALLLPLLPPRSESMGQELRAMTTVQTSSRSAGDTRSASSVETTCRRGHTISSRKRRETGAYLLLSVRVTVKVSVCVLMYRHIMWQRVTLVFRDDEPTRTHDLFEEATGETCLCLSVSVAIYCSREQCCFFRDASTLFRKQLICRCVSLAVKREFTLTPPPHPLPPLLVRGGHRLMFISF